MPVVVVTGGGRGLGAALVRLLVAEKYRVVFSTRNGPKEDLPPEAIHMATGDFANADNVRSFAQRVLSEVGPVRFLINNAGEMTSPEQPVMQCTVAEMEHSMAVNCIAPMLLMQAFVPKMNELGGGAVVNVSSGQGAMYGMSGCHFAYRSSKAALNALTLVFAAEHPNVRINSVCPGIVETSMTAHLVGFEKVSPADAAEQMLWLLADDAPTGGFFRNGEQIYW